MESMIIDALTHISTGPDYAIGWGPKFLAEDLIAQMDAPRTFLGRAARIDRAIVFPALGDTVPTSPLSFEEQHRYVISSVDKYPDRLVGGAVVHARLWDNEVADQLRRMVRDHGFRVLYIHPALHLYRLPSKAGGDSGSKDNLFSPLFEAAREMRMPVLIYSGSPPFALPGTVDTIAGQFPDVPIIIGHLGMQGVVYTLEALLLAKRHKNVFLETSYAKFSMLIEAVSEVGAARIIFGSNCPPLEPTQQLMVVEESLVYPPPVGMGLPADEVVRITGGNMNRLLSRVRPG